MSRTRDQRLTLRLTGREKSLILKLAEMENKNVTETILHLVRKEFKNLENN